MKVYINYPNPHITIHRNRSCSLIQMQGKENQRLIHVTPDTLGKVLSDFAAKKYPFKKGYETNDLWLDVELKDEKQNECFVRMVQAITGNFYKPLKNAQIIEHECK